jgi:hypothetical protein
MPTLFGSDERKVPYLPVNRDRIAWRVEDEVVEAAAGLRTRQSFNRIRENLASDSIRRVANCLLNV